MKPPLQQGRGDWQQQQQQKYYGRGDDFVGFHDECWGSEGGGCETKW